MSETTIKITAYEVREDEREYFLQQARLFNLDITYTSKALSKETLHYAEGSSAITVLGQCQIQEPLLSELKSMNIDTVATRTVGYNHIDIVSAKALGIRVTNSGYGPHGVADYTVMLILMTLRKYKQALYRINVNDYSLPGLQGREMKDLTIGVVGVGKIGKQVLLNLQGFGCKLMAHSRREDAELKGIATYASLEELYAKCDVISYHVPLTNETHHMVNEASIAMMKDNVMLINCSRGEIMKIDDIIDGIEKQTIGAMALDVFENESGIYHVDRRNDIISNKEMAYLRQFPNVIMSQHIAFYTNSAVESMVVNALTCICQLHHYNACDYHVNA